MNQSMKVSGNSKEKTSRELGGFYCFPPKASWAVGSERIYTIQLQEELQRMGVAAKSIDYAETIFIGKNYLMDFLTKFEPKKSCRYVAMNPSSELYMMSQEKLSFLDLIVVGSFEERSAVSHLGIRTHIFPLIEKSLSSLYPNGDEESAPKPYTLMYHGNRAHLEELGSNITKSLEDLAKLVPVNLLLVYNYEKRNTVKLKIPGVNIQHVPWSVESLLKAALVSDIGIVPALESHGFRFRNLRSVARRFLRISEDKSIYLEFKKTSNYGRALVFMQLGLPVIAEPSPSNAALIPTPEYGELALTRNEWLLSFHRFQSKHERELVVKKTSEHIRALSLDFSSQTRLLLDRLSDLPAAGLGQAD